MRDRLLGLRRSVCTLIVGATVSAWLPAASGQSSPAPAPSLPPDSPATSPGGDTPAQLAERLRKMEETNQKLLRQFESITKQNELLTRQVQELSKRIDDSAGARKVDQASARRGGGDGGTDETAPSVSESAARPSRSPGDGTAGRAAPGAGTSAGAAGGPDPTAPSVSEDAARPSRTPGGGVSNRIKLNAVYDQQRYGYLIQSEDQEFELRFNALAQVDARIYSNTQMNPSSATSTSPGCASTSAAA